jgi:hypothetical protein
MKWINFLASLGFTCGYAVAGHAQVMSKANEANPSTQGYATSGAALKDQHTKSRKASSQDRAAAHQPSPGTSPAETAGAATPNDSSKPGKSKEQP